MQALAVRRDCCARQRRAARKVPQFGRKTEERRQHLARVLTEQWRVAAELGIRLHEPPGGGWLLPGVHARMRQFHPVASRGQMGVVSAASASTPGSATTSPPMAIADSLFMTPPFSRTLPALLDEQALLHGDAIAVTDPFFQSRLLHLISS